MALTTHVDIVSAESLLFSGLAERVVVPAEMGDLGILPRHAPLLARLKPGLVRVMINEAQEEVFFISSGFVEVQSHTVTILGDTVLRSKDLDEAAALAAKSHSEEAIRTSISPKEYSRIKTELALSLSLLRAIDELRRRGKR
jgi:F-type H+-transporting ATPase subunit epsilon